MATADWSKKTSDAPEELRRQWRADRALRPAMRSPGRPDPSRVVQRQFWRLIATGITSAELAPVGVEECRLHPRRGAGHQDRDEGGVLGDAGQVERDHRQARVERDCGGSVEEPREVTRDEASQGMADQSSVLGEPGVGIVGRVRGEEPVYDHREDWYVGTADGAIDGDVDGGVLERSKAAFEHGLGQRSDEVTPTGCDLAGPLSVVVSRGAMALIEGVEPVGHAMAQRDGASADRFGDDASAMRRSELAALTLDDVEFQPGGVANVLTALGDAQPRLALMSSINVTYDDSGAYQPLMDWKR